MFHDLQQAFRQAVRNFHEALDESDSSAALNREDTRPQTPGAKAELQGALIHLQATLSALEEEIRRNRSGMTKERQALRDCERRGLLAAQVQDSETVELARRFAERHRSYLALLMEKDDLLLRELMHHRKTLEELLVRGSLDSLPSTRRERALS